METKNIVVKIKRLDKDLPLPKYAYKGDAAFDLFAREDVLLLPGERFGVPSGIALEIPEDYVGLIWDKSSIGLKQGIKTLGGVIDSSFRGEIFIGVINLGKETYTFTRGQKVAQMIIQKKENVSLLEVSDLSSSERGEKGFGSSGK